MTEKSWLFASAAAAAERPAILRRLRRQRRD
jgi:hypothetical protein